MATFKDLKNDWSMLCQDCTDCWTHSDLQLAAELGKTLLERNKELETMIKLHQTTVEEQAQEIEYMKKQTVALREVNDSRLKIYEQLEVSIQDLERANHRLVIENTSDKKLIKSQCLAIENLEARCEELQKKIDELNELNTSLLQQQQQQQQQQAANQSLSTAQAQTATWKGSVTPGGSIQQSAAPYTPKLYQEANVDSNALQLANAVAAEEEVNELLRQLQEAKSQRAREQKKVTELGQQLATLVQENSNLEQQLNIWRSKAQDVKNLQEEINMLEEVKRGQLCVRCLCGIDVRTHDELSVMLDHEDYDDISIAESLINDNQRENESVVQESNKSSVGGDESNKNPYRDLVEKYQALFEVSRHPVVRRKNSIPATCMSLQEELEMSGEFNSFQNPTTETELQQDSGKNNGTNGTRANKAGMCGKKPFSATPTDFSEAETSSSGFSDETSNKATQTDGRLGSLLCSIADGEDCKFSIYDDNSPIESRFRKTPEYRQIFSEIFSVLKRAAEAKDEGEKLSLLGDSTSTTTTQAQSSVLTQEDIPSEATDDNQSIVSSVVSSVVSEPVYRVQTPISTNATNDQQNKTETNNTCAKKSKESGQQNGNGLPLDYLSVNVHVTKRSGSKKNGNRRSVSNDITSNIIPTTNPKLVPSKSHSGGKKKFRPLTTAETNGTIFGVFNCTNKTRESPNNGRRSVRSSNNTEQHNNSFEMREYKPSTASEEVAKLRRLEMSYAEVLRNSNPSKVNKYRRS